MDKINKDAFSHYHSMVDYGDDRNDKEIEKDASWKALHDQTPRMPRKTYRDERARLTDRRSAAKAYVKGSNFENESRHMNKKLTKLSENKIRRIIRESVDNIINGSQQPTISPKELAQILYDNGVNGYDFANKLKHAFLDIEHNPQNRSEDAKMQLVQAIKNAETFVDTTDRYKDGSTECGCAKLTDYICVNDIYFDEVEYNIYNGNVFFYGTDTFEEDGGNIRPSDKLIPKIIELIK